MIDFGRGVFLARIQQGDLMTMFRWRNSRQIWQWCRQNDILSWHEHEAWFEKQKTDSTLKMYTIYDNCDQDEAEQKMVGVCGLTSIDQLNRRAEFSLYIGPGLQEMGFGKKALWTLCQHGFKNLGLNCIWGETFNGNPAARMFEGLGFKHEGTRREFYFRDGEFIDAHIFSVLASEWK